MLTTKVATIKNAHPTSSSDIRTFLGSLHSLRISVQALREREAFFFHVASSTAYEDSTAATPDRVGDNVSSAVDHARALRRQADKLIAREQEAEVLLARLRDPRQREVLTLRYLNDWHWTRIAEAMDITYSRVHGLAREGIAYLTKLEASEAELDTAVGN